jgi:hypothetical protein
MDQQAVVIVYFPIVNTTDVPAGWPVELDDPECPAS